VELTRNQFRIHSESRKTVTDQKSDGPEIHSEERTKERNMDEATISLNYGKTSTDALQIMIKCKDTDGKENKEECPMTGSYPSWSTFPLYCNVSKLLASKISVP
jgi:hypothetical protein